MSYIGMHNKIRRVKGRAHDLICDACGKPARHWAFTNRSGAEIIDSQGRRYSRELDDYRPMCQSCHQRMDKAAITHCPQGHEYSPVNTIIDAGKRKCRTCVYARNRTRPLTPEARARKAALQRQRRREQLLDQITRRGAA